ncbi:SDR family NAD(P)-dependent oxidoreductase [Gordonia rubripertincta]|uniref:SDR family NAD(P)-dependent oxidoreductase n=1 Tax=Gordonia rubripertincta TaxID=36822 RepID=A0ABT4MVL4_GORRU|nr:SDR family NAD(P)-dependent oxidoreductase [Gordonia rubripertincta]MCZ4551031.1 SDR family NAD(P)-dependent oxidoreductase [Gordonia rubripertincta]
MARFEHTVALVTGGASGIGAAVGRQLLDEGASVVLFDLDAEALKTAAESLGPRVAVYAGNVTIESDVAAAVDLAVTTFGGLDATFNIAGTAKFGTITDIATEDWLFTVDVVLKGTFLTTRHAARAMRSGGKPGVIVNVASLNAHVPLYGASSYAAAKAGVECFTKNSALELGADGIRVNAVLPGLVQTPMTAPLMSVESIAKDFTDRIIMNRPGQPSEIADACLYLASEQASYITGTSLVVDGGWEITNYPNLSSVI